MAKRKRRPQAGPEFMRRTQFKNLGPTGQARREPPPMPELHYRGETIDLPEPAQIETTEIDLRRAIDERKSERVFFDDPITLDELTYLLWATQGVKEFEQGETFRTVPSAGARHAFETYIVANNVEGLDRGLYRYLSMGHKLGIIDQSEEIGERIANTTLQPELIQTSAATFIWTTVATRMTWRYGDRGYRYIHLDAGHVGQNLYLGTMAVNCRACTSAAFNDDELNRTLKLDGVEHFAVYFGSVGK